MYRWYKVMIYKHTKLQDINLFIYVLQYKFHVVVYMINLKFMTFGISR